MSDVDMRNVGEVFIEAYESALAFLSAPTTAVINDVLRELSVDTRTTGYLENDGLIVIRDLTFTKPEVTDFIFSLSFQFYSKWGKDNEGIKQLAKLLAVGITQPFDKDEISLLPVEYGERFINEGEMTTLLEQNRWLVMVLLVRLFLRPEVPETPIEK